MLDLAAHRVCVTGGAGFLGQYVVEAIARRGIPQPAIFVPRRDVYDLRNAAAVSRLYDDSQCDVVIHLAAVVGGIGANREHPGRFFHENMALGMNMIEEGRRRRIRKFVHIGTVCSYPKHCPVPFREASLWNGYPEETNAPYGIAKRALIAMLDAYHREYGLPAAVVLPANLYGPGDHFDLHTSHVIPALIRRMEQARIAGEPSVTCWGTGCATREFLYVADAAEAIVRTAERMETPQPINLGSGQEITIRALAEKIAQICGYEGGIRWDENLPDGQPRRCLDVSQAQARLAWQCSTPLDEGLRTTVDWYRQQALAARGG